MTPAEAQALLTVAASFDNRKPDPDAAMAWSLALDGLRFTDARDAIVAHYRRSSDWVMPAMIHAAVRKVRSDRVAAAGPQTPPAGLTDAQELAWQRDAIRRIADGETIAPTRELGSYSLGDVRGVIAAPPTAKRDEGAAERAAKRKAAEDELRARKEIPVAEPLGDDGEAA